jgi:hypothetical protein
VRSVKRNRKKRDVEMIKRKREKREEKRNLKVLLRLRSVSFNLNS